ncbi:alpha/beta hydrolase [Sphingomonas rhizophila]|uniref:Alpha/beta hydrolase n=1 Tax=Sphingomonas rhizophila TaxID=2071607 RepID=A0A7G9SBQ8_9SPHN|nr:alpha/beta hydrolase [Sphingomonas rhizophila]QNN65283.1 alpha/beta hydrolase [Sphingomonas rhizophila]
MSRSRHLVDPALAGLLEAWPTVTLTAENLSELRNRDLPLPPVEDCGVDWAEEQVPGPDGAPDVTVRIYTPRDGKGLRGCILHIHGGGFVGGSVREIEFLHRPLAAALDCVIVTVEYRLAPESPFPGAIEDCYSALAWTHRNAAGLGIDPRRIGVMGESAGGGLAAALALLARDRGEFPLAFQHLVYPMLDDRTCVRDEHPFAGEFIWHPTNNAFGWSALLGHEPGRDDVSPYAAPARATDLSELPPSYIATAALDLFVDEDIDYAQQLIRAGVPTEFHIWPGAYHGFDLMPGVAVADAARASSEAALRRFLEKQP